MVRHPLIGEGMRRERAPAAFFFSRYLIQHLTLSLAPDFSQVIRSSKNSGKPFCFRQLYPNSLLGSPELKSGANEI
jgi:hypothetical protein